MIRYILQIICEAYFFKKMKNEQIAHFIWNDSEIGFMFFFLHLLDFKPT